VRFWFSISIILMPVSLLAQLTAPGSNAVRYTSYPTLPNMKDPVFFYCNITGTESGTLTATHANGTGNYKFTWYRWNDLTTSFSTWIKTDTGVASSSITNLNEDGYKVDIDSAGTIFSLVGWIFFDRQPVAGASLQQQLCYRVALNGDTAALIHNFFYKNIIDGLPVPIKNEITFLWSSTPTSVIPYPDIFLDPVTYSPPLEDVTYKLKVFSLGCTSESSFFYESIHVKADFSIDPNEGEAPLEVSFTDKSIRGNLYTWDFGDDTISHIKDPMIHTYYKPGEYSVMLTIESDLHCIDSTDRQIIKVEPSALIIPNVFTPDDDGYNDRFLVSAKSMRYISMEVFSQSGLKVYGFSGEGERLKEWQGWDGRINNSSIEARPGIYFYIIRAYGWDDIKYDSKEYRGFVYLYR
jgi:hypothetical protein